ncbi:MAG TPA: hypothetical protein VM536_04100, partial [Chloroflexia bacterium]|nr:hypothetical protein [Chloroflexia bacterium]
MEQAMNVPQADGSTVPARWTVDLGAAGRCGGWGRSNPGLLAQEVREMATYFPRWLLTAANANGRVPCGQCGGVLVFRDGQPRCAACGQAGKGTHLAWMGHL